MHYYDYSFLNDLKITSKLIGLSNAVCICNYKAEIQKRDYPDLFVKLHEQAIIESTISSSRIEGVETSRKREEDLLVRNDKPLNHSEQEISGYRDAAVFISDHHNELDINEKTIRYIHSLLMYYTPGTKGEYKTTDNEISVRYEDGRRETIFEPISHRDVADNMRQLIEAYQNALNDSGINRMLLIPCFIVDFLAIHPFADGNGRVSRLLTLLMLYKEGYDVGKYISYEKMIEEYKWNYYEELNRAQNGWHNNANDYSPFIVFHFQMLYRCYMKMSERFIEQENGRILNKQQRIEKTVTKAIVPISKKEIAELLPDISITTIEKKLNEMLKEGRISKIGTYKNARYVAKHQSVE